MKVTGTVVVVGEKYAKLFTYIYVSWFMRLDSILIVTDSETGKKLTSLNYNYSRTKFAITDAFTRNGATFNKGLALEETRDKTATGWQLYFDGDIEIPSAYTFRLDKEKLDSNCIYGARRTINGVTYPDKQPAGYHLLFNADAPALKNRDQWFTSWQHAGNYDTDFLNLWPQENQRWLKNIEVKHHGKVGNWFGADDQEKNAELMQEMYSLRRKKGGWQHERV